jgi:hypothetical protein
MLYYLGGQLRVALEEKITKDTIQQVKDKNLEKLQKYGGPIIYIYIHTNK